MTSTVDYVVVGAGLTGCVVAHRLARAGHKVLLLEAGKDPTGNPNITTPLGGFALLGSELDWCYPSTPQPTTANRVHTLNAGKALGGGTTINYGGWLRGDAGDYNAWADRVADKRWSYEGLLPWFRKSETYYDAAASKSQHGFDGPINVTSITASHPNRRYPLRDPIRAAWAELGVTFNKDQDNGSITGLAEFHENSKDGERQPSNLAYPLSLPGLALLTEAHVARVKFDGMVAVGVELVDGRSFKASKEVVLCAGALRTPQLLQLSGVGPAALLTRHGIPVVSDLPAVGENLHDHFALYMAFRLKAPERGLALGTFTDPAFFTGLPYDWVINELDKPTAVQDAISREAAPSSFAQSLLTHPRPLVENFTVYAPAGLPGIPTDGSHIASSSMLITPTSRGSVSISSSSATDFPLINSGYLSTEVDQQGLLHAGRRMLRAMLTTSAMKDFVECETPPSGLPGLENLVPLTADASDAAILDRIERTGAQHHHSGGTVAMGSAVDTEGKVIGVRNLRVADASMIPVPVAGHPQATLYAVAEQLASMIVEAA